MNFDRFFTSPPPATGWILSSGQCVVVHRTATEEIHCAAEDCPDGAFDVGPVGLQSLDAETVAPVLARLKGAAEGARTAAVIVPTGWLRSYLIDIERPPRREEELHDVVRWRLKKLLPVPPADLRLSVVRLAEIEEQRRLLVLAGIERAMASIEACFRSIGVEVGLITTRLFALVPRGADAMQSTLVIQSESGFLSLLLLSNGVPRLLRTKPLAASDDSTGPVLREIAITSGFIRDSVGVDGEIGVRLSCEDPGLDERMREWLHQQDGFVPIAEASHPPCGPTTVVDRLGAAQVDPGLAVVTGALR